LVEDVREAGMSGLVLKAHEGQTYDRASLIRMRYPALNVFGGLVCNAFVGGLNPSAVDVAIQMGAKIIWMPTLSAEQHHNYYSDRGSGKLFNSSRPLTGLGSTLTVLNEEGNVLPEVEEILHLIAENDVVLATGHLSPREVEVLVPRAKKIGVDKILIQHVDLGIAKIPLVMQKALADQGCILEKCYLACASDFNDLSIEEMAHTIGMLSASSCAIVTDFGQAHNVAPVEALGQFIGALLSHGLTEGQIERMVSSNPRQLLDIA
jgi:hypothetical protein